MKRSFSVDGVMSGIIMVVVTVIIMIARVEETHWSDVAVALCCILPFLFVWFSILLHPLGQEKIFYLLPMSAKERRDKLLEDYLRRSVLHLTVFALGSLLLFLRDGGNIRTLLVMVCNGGLLSFCSCRSRNATGESICFTLLAAIALFTNLLAADYMETGAKAQIICCFVILVVIQMPLFLGHVSKMRSWFARSVNYEEVSA